MCLVIKRKISWFECYFFKDIHTKMLFLLSLLLYTFLYSSIIMPMVYSILILHLNTTHLTWKKLGRIFQLKTEIGCYKNILFFNATNIWIRNCVVKSCFLKQKIDDHGGNRTWWFDDNDDYELKILYKKNLCKLTLLKCWQHFVYGQSRKGVVLVLL